MAEHINTIRKSLGYLGQLDDTTLTTLDYAASNLSWMSEEDFWNIIGKVFDAGVEWSFRSIREAEEYYT